MEIFKFKTSDKGKLFDVKILQIEKEICKEYEIFTKIQFKTIKRTIFYALVNGNVEIVEIDNSIFNKMIEKINSCNNDDFYFRFEVGIKEFLGKEYVYYNFEFIPSKLYKKVLPEVKSQIEEFDFTFEKAINQIKDSYSKESHWSNFIKIN